MLLIHVHVYHKFAWSLITISGLFAGAAVPSYQCESAYPRELWFLLLLIIIIIVCHTPFIRVERGTCCPQHQATSDSHRCLGSFARSLLCPTNKLFEVKQSGNPGVLIFSTHIFGCLLTFRSAPITNGMTDTFLHPRFF